jgi:osmotically-inducible protein OsmY
MRLNTLRNLAAVAAISLGVAACAVAEGQSTAGQYVDDATISTQVRAKIVNDPNVKLSQVDVRTLNQEVQLSGFVDNLAAKTRAGEIARSVNGVKSVKNDIVVRP